MVNRISTNSQTIAILDVIDGQIIELPALGNESNSVACMVSFNGSVRCSPEIYENPALWRISQQSISQQIRKLQSQIKQLKVSLPAFLPSGLGRCSSYLACSPVSSVCRIRMTRGLLTLLSSTRDKKPIQKTSLLASFQNKKTSRYHSSCWLPSINYQLLHFVDTTFQSDKQ